MALSHHTGSVLQYQGVTPSHHTGSVTSHQATAHGNQGASPSRKFGPLIVPEQETSVTPETKSEDTNSPYDDQLKSFPFDVLCNDGFEKSESTLRPGVYVHYASSPCYDRPPSIYVLGDRRHVGLTELVHELYMGRAATIQPFLSDAANLANILRYVIPSVVQARNCSSTQEQVEGILALAHMSCYLAQDETILYTVNCLDISLGQLTYTDQRMNAELVSDMKRLMELLNWSLPQSSAAVLRGYLRCARWLLLTALAHHPDLVSSQAVITSVNTFADKCAHVCDGVKHSTDKLHHETCILSDICKTIRKQHQNPNSKTVKLTNIVLALIRLCTTSAQPQIARMCETVAALVRKCKKEKKGYMLAVVLEVLCNFVSRNNSPVKEDTIDPAFRNLENLETLVLDDNNITHFPDHVLRDMMRMRKLSINKQTSPSMNGVYCQLKSLPRDMMYIDHLTHLHVAKNELQHVPEEIKYMKQLEELELTDNKFISVIPEGIGKLTRLKYLGLSGNCIERLPGSIGQLRELQVLRLSCNRLQCLPEDICHLTHLMTLSMQENQLVYLPLNFDRLTSLDKGKEQVYRSDLMEGRQFPSLLNLRKNDSIRFPCSCESMTAAEVFDMYARLRAKGTEAMIDILNDAKEHVTEKAAIEKQWRFLDEALLADLSRGIGFDWRILGFNLGLNQEDIEQFLANHPGNVAGSIAEMFIRWRDRCHAKKVDEREMILDVLQAMTDIENNALRHAFIEKLKLKGWKQ